MGAYRGEIRVLAGSLVWKRYVYIYMDTYIYRVPYDTSGSTHDSLKNSRVMKTSTRARGLTAPPSHGLSL
jgi:hypothetical protein